MNANSTRFELLDPASGTVLARAVEVVQGVGDTRRRDTTYTDVKNHAVHKESYEFDSRTRRLGRYSFESASGESALVEAAGTEDVSVTYKADGQSRVESSLIPFDAQALHGQAIPDLILSRWSDLTAGRKVRFDLLVPSRLETIGFQARFDEAKSRADDAVFVVEASSWFIRQFAPDMTFVFSNSGNPAHRRLRELIGPSPIVLNGERYKKVRMVMLDGT